MKEKFGQENQKSEKLYDGITDIRDDLVDQARPKQKKFWNKNRFAAAAAVLVLVSAGVFALRPQQRQMASGQTIAEAKYEEMAQYPNEEDFYNNNGEFDDDGYAKAYDIWWEDVRARRELIGYAQGMERFLTDSAEKFLSSEEAENMVYSPLNVYLALGMLAELTDGNSRLQILDLLGSKDMQSLRKQASDLWNANYYDDGLLTSILASSLWLDQDVSFVQSTMDTIAEIYRASSYRGEMGSASLNQRLQDWINKQTGGILKDQASGVKMSAETILALATTIYFRAQWDSAFSKAQTEGNVFHTDDGDVTCAFMRKESIGENYYWGDKFSAVSQGLKSSGCMWFILPDEGVSAQELLSDSQAMEFLVSSSRTEWENQKSMLVNLAVPKFDVASNIDLRKGLQELGVTDVFDMELSDFSPMTRDYDEIYVSKADHAARVAVDEEGVEAAAFTVIMADAGAGMPSGEEIDFVLDRPFVFAITGMDGLPLFIGIVQHPQLG